MRSERKEEKKKEKENATKGGRGGFERFLLYFFFPPKKIRYLIPKLTRQAHHRIDWGGGCATCKHMQRPSLTWSDEVNVEGRLRRLSGVKRVRLLTFCLRWRAFVWDSEFEAHHQLPLHNNKSVPYTHTSVRQRRWRWIMVAISIARYAFNGITFSAAFSQSLCLVLYLCL